MVVEEEEEEEEEERVALSNPRTTPSQLNAQVCIVFLSLVINQLINPTSASTLPFLAAGESRPYKRPAPPHIRRQV